MPQRQVLEYHTDLIIPIAPEKEGELKYQDKIGSKKKVFVSKILFEISDKGFISLLPSTNTPYVDDFKLKQKWKLLKHNL